MNTIGRLLAVTCLSTLIHGCDANFGPASDEALEADDIIDQVPLGPFGEATLVEELSIGESEDDPTLCSDLLEIFFNRKPGGSGQIFTATRDTITSQWKNIGPVSELNVGLEASNPEVSPDCKTMHYSRRNNGKWRIFRSTRPDRDSPWSPPIIVEELEPGTSKFPSILADNNRRMLVVFASAEATDIYESTRDTVGDPWSDPIMKENLNSAARDNGAHFSSDGLTVYLDSRRSGGKGGADLYQATRSDFSASFDVPAPTDLSALNTSEDETDPWISEDGRYIVFARGSGTSRALYEAHR